MVIKGFEKVDDLHRVKKDDVDNACSLSSSFMPFVTTTQTHAYTWALSAN